MITQLSQAHDRIKDEFDLKGRMGNTHYLDFLYPDEIPKNKMKGRDIFDRDFIILKVGIYDYNRQTLKKTGQVFFQRYPRSELTHPSYFYNWQGATLDGEFLHTGGGISEAQIKLICDIVNNKKIMVESKHRVCKFRENDRKEIASMDYWEDWAARVIQRQFLKCRYDPKYSICKKIVNRQFNEYLNGTDDS
tara:strand:+ start:647 stop:1222 length:576 start_codon:yes stop_codon:yes gene_type:complete